MKKLFSISCVFVSFLLGSCAHPSMYQNSLSIPPLVIPPGAHKLRSDNYYVVPQLPIADQKPVSLIPPGSRAYQLHKEKT